MSTQLVKIKGTKSGLIVQLDEQAEMAELKQELAYRFQESAGFFKDAQMTIAFRGRSLSEKEEEEFLNIISENSKIRVVCVMHEDDFTAQAMEAAARAAKGEPEKKPETIVKTVYVREPAPQPQVTQTQGDCLFYKGVLRSGQSIEAEQSIIILGDVNVGASVVSAGNIIVLGALKGNAFVGATGNDHAFVAALSMDPMQIRISNFIARSADEEKEKEEKSIFPKKKKVQEDAQSPKIAYVYNGNIYIEPITKDSLNDIQL